MCAWVHGIFCGQHFSWYTYIHGHVARKGIISRNKNHAHTEFVRCFRYESPIISQWNYPSTKSTSHLHTVCAWQHIPLFHSYRLVRLCKELAQLLSPPSHQNTPVTRMGASLSLLSCTKPNKMVRTGDLHVYVHDMYMHVHVRTSPPVIRYLPYIDVFVIIDPWERICTWATPPWRSKHQLL
jgi:hypothetical protein